MTDAFLCRAGSVIGSTRTRLALAAAAMALTMPLALMAGPTPLEANASKHALQCPARLVAACKTGHHVFCTKRNAQGCCIRSRCQPNN